jgi:hypothetical protein
MLTHEKLIKKFFMWTLTLDADELWGNLKLALSHPSAIQNAKSFQLFTSKVKVVNTKCVVWSFWSDGAFFLVHQKIHDNCMNNFSW